MVFKMASNREKLPNLKICLDNTEDDNDIEEELSIDDNVSDEDDIVVQPEIVADDDEAENVEFNVKLTGVQSENMKEKPKFKPEFPKKYENKSGNFITGIDITSKEAQEKKKERAQRFGLPITDEEEAKIDLTALYVSLGIREGDVHKDERGIRLEAIHLRGTDNMSTQDVFKYFSDFAPGAVEWIDDASCNVVWLDTVTAARAMMQLSHSDEMADSQLEQRRRSRKHRPSSLDREGSKPGDVEMVETDAPVPHGFPKTSEASTDVKPEEPHSASEEQQMEVEEDDDELDLCADDEPKAKEPVAAEGPSQPHPLLEQSSEGPSQPQPLLEQSDEGAHQRKSKVLDGDSDSGVEDNTSDRDDDELENHSDQDTSSSKRNQNDAKTRIDDSTVCSTVKDSARTERSIPWPPGKWRLGIESPKARFLFMRFATKADKKILGAEKKSKYYQKYGNPNYGGMKGLISGTRKRKLRYNRYKDEIDEAHDAVVSHRLSKTSSDVVEAAGSADDEPEEGEIVDSGGDEDDPAVCTKISPLNRSTDDAKEKEDKDDELDLDAELEQLLGAPPKKRMMRMYADDEEEQIKAKRIARSGVFTVTTDIPDSKPNKPSLGKIKDARELIKQAALRPKLVSNSSQLGSNDLRARLLNKRKKRVDYHSASDDDVDDDSDVVVRTDLRARLTVTQARSVDSPSSSYSFPTAQRVSKSGWGELSHSEPGRNGQADDSGGRTLVKYESDSDDSVTVRDERKSRRGAVKGTASDNSESSSYEQDSRTRKSRTRLSDSSAESDMSESDDDRRVRSSDLRSRLRSRRKPNREYPSMRIEVLD